MVDKLLAKIAGEDRCVPVWRPVRERSLKG